ncbi:MAG: hypothetical protein ACO1Q7_00085, partial [Gemmatimonas sp.]
MRHWTHHSSAHVRGIRKIRDSSFRELLPSVFPDTRRDMRTALLLSLLPLAGAAATPPDDGSALVVMTAHWRDRAQL